MKIKKILFLCKVMILSVFIYGCGSDDTEKKRVKMNYLAINDADTALLKLIITGSQFKGQYEINYHGNFKDSGDVKGTIKGDTLLGDYHYQHYGIEKWQRVPIALLKKDEKLILGIGSTETYLGISYFRPGTVIDYDQVKFIFQKTD
jgi:hypothetical protein